MTFKICYFGNQLSIYVSYKSYKSYSSVSVNPSAVPSVSIIVCDVFYNKYVVTHQYIHKLHPTVHARPTNY